ncbi:MAG: hypothetical protein JWP19_1206, partial [Rhodoglobus sp.]|nr:hypothetical protein [Rhodoglobus sp.]
SHTRDLKEVRKFFLEIANVLKEPAAAGAMRQGRGLDGCRLGRRGAGAGAG